MAKAAASQNEKLPKRRRLARSGEYELVMTEGLRVSSSQLRLVGHPNRLGYSRLGLAVSLRVSRRAVDRNRMKRRLREIFRKNPRRFAGGTDFVLVPFASALALTFQDLSAVVLRLASDYERRRAQSSRG